VNGKEAFNDVVVAPDRRMLVLVRCELTIEAARSTAVI
jgi:hypothetical protein